jgi:hypothetical protein
MTVIARRNLTECSLTAFYIRQKVSGFLGRSTRIRTLDLIVPNDANYRAVLHSEKLVAGLGFEPRMAKAYETSLVTGPFPR